MKRNQFILGTIAAAVFCCLFSGCSSKNSASSEDTNAPSSGASGGKSVDLETAGEITGTVKLHGTPPEMKEVQTAAIISCAKGNVADATNDEVVTGEGGTLANAFVYVKSGLEGYSFPVSPEPVEIDQKGCQFAPHVAALQAGQNLQVTNRDSTSHNIHPIPKNNREWNVSQGPGQPPIVKAFARPEIVIPVKCNVHPWMKAYIAVSPNPYFQVTHPDGAFALKHLPPGTYTLAIWHERYGTSEQTVTLGPKESKEVTFTFEAGTGGVH